MQLLIDRQPLHFMALRVYVFRCFWKVTQDVHVSHFWGAELILERRDVFLYPSLVAEILPEVLLF